MKKQIKLFALLLGIVTTGFIVSCGNDDDGIVIDPTLAIEFSSPTASVAENGDPITITISFPSAPAAVTVTAAVTGTATYTDDYTTSPAVANSLISLSIDQGDTEATITFTPVDNNGTDGVKTVVFTLQPADGLELGTNKSLTVSITDDDSPGLSSLDENFEMTSLEDNDEFVLTDWINYAEMGTRTASFQVSSGNGSVEFSSFSSDEMSNIFWVVLPKVNFDDLSVKEMSFWNQVLFGDQNTSFDLLYSTDFDGTDANIPSASWTELTGWTKSSVDFQWVESGTIDLSAISGNGYLAFKYQGSDSEDNDASYRIDNILIGSTAPSLTITESLSDFGSVDNGNTSTEQSFTLEGVSISGDVTVEASEGFEVSLTSGSGFGSSITISDVSTAQTVYVVFAPNTGLNNEIEGEITISASNITDKTIDLSGTESGNAELDLSLPINETFETDGLGTRYLLSAMEFSDGSADYFGRVDDDGISIGSFIEFDNPDGAYFAAHDINGEGGPDILEMYISGINVTGVTSLDISIDVAEDDASNEDEDWDDDTSFRVEYRVDDGSYQTLIAIEAKELRGDGSSNSFNKAPAVDTNLDGVGDGVEITDAFQTLSETISVSGDILDIRLVFDTIQDGDEDIAIDNIKVEETAP